MMTTVSGVSVELKLVMVCSTPSSNTLKSFLSSPLINVPFLSTTTTSRLTTSTSIAIDFPLAASLGWSGGGGRPAPASRRGPWATRPAAAHRATNATKIIRIRMGVNSVVRLSECPFAAQDFDLPLPPLVNADFHQGYRRRHCRQQSIHRPMKGKQGGN